MKNLVFILFSFWLFACDKEDLAIALGEGEEPHITTNDETVRIVYGQGENIMFTARQAGEKNFSTPSIIANVPGMHLGMGRGPQFASSTNYSLVTAIDKTGTIHAFMMDHKTSAWSKVTVANDTPQIAPEGLMALAADDRNHFYAAWLDLRVNNKNNIAFAAFNADSATWSKNRVVYISPSGSVCPCCRPSIAVSGGQISIMFRNSVDGARDLHIITSNDQGKTFAHPTRLGLGTWLLDACPMDGGELMVDNQGTPHTIWQRDGKIFYARPGAPETLLAEGRLGVVTGSSSPFYGWQTGNDLFVQAQGKKIQQIGSGTSLDLAEASPSIVAAAWSSDKQIFFRDITF